MFSKSFAVLTLSTIWLLSRDGGARVWSWALGPDESAHFHLQAQVCVVSFIQIFLLFVLSVITSRSVRS